MPATNGLPCLRRQRKRARKPGLTTYSAADCSPRGAPALKPGSLLDKYPAGQSKQPSGAADECHHYKNQFRVYRGPPGTLYRGAPAAVEHGRQPRWFGYGEGRAGLVRCVYVSGRIKPQSFGFGRQLGRVGTRFNEKRLSISKHGERSGVLAGIRLGTNRARTRLSVRVG